MTPTTVSEGLFQYCTYFIGFRKWIWNTQVVYVWTPRTILFGIYKICMVKHFILWSLNLSTRSSSYDIYHWFNIGEMWIYIKISNTCISICIATTSYNNLPRFDAIKVLLITFKLSIVYLYYFRTVWWLTIWPIYFVQTPLHILFY